LIGSNSAPSAAAVDAARHVRRTSPGIDIQTVLELTKPGNKHIETVATSQPSRKAPSWVILGLFRVLGNFPRRSLRRS